MSKAIYTLNNKPSFNTSFAQTPLHTDFSHSFFKVQHASVRCKSAAIKSSQFILIFLQGRERPDSLLIHQEMNCEKSLHLASASRCNEKRER